MGNEEWCTWCAVNIGKFPEKRIVGWLYPWFLYSWFCACIPVFSMMSCSLCSYAGLPQLFPLGASVHGFSLLSWWTSWVHAFLPMFWWCKQLYQWMCVSIVSGHLISHPPGLHLFLVLVVSSCIHRVQERIPTKKISWKYLNLSPFSMCIPNNKIWWKVFYFLLP